MTLKRIKQEKENYGEEIFLTIKKIKDLLDFASKNGILLELVIKTVIFKEEYRNYLRDFYKKTKDLHINKVWEKKIFETIDFYTPTTMFLYDKEYKKVKLDDLGKTYFIISDLYHNLYNLVKFSFSEYHQKEMVLKNCLAEICLIGIRDSEEFKIKTLEKQLKTKKMKNSSVTKKRRR